MACFRCGISGAAPLRVQLGTNSSTYIEITTINAFGETTTGSASRPVVTHPTNPGSGTGTVVGIDSPVAVSGVDGITAFTVAPSNPTVSTFSANLPMRIHTRTPKGSGYIVPPNSYALLYAVGNGGHTWTGSLEWEEL